MKFLIAIAITVSFVGCTAIDDVELPTESVSQAITCPLPAPIPYGPSGNSAISTPVYSWGAVPGADSYTLYAEVTNGAAIEHASNITDTWWQNNDVAAYANQQLRWKVKTESACGAGPYSPYMTFKYTTGSTATCYPSLAACQAGCINGTCERRINCGGANAHKCFQP